MEFRCGTNLWWRFCMLWARIAHDQLLQVPWMDRQLTTVCMGIVKGSDGLWSPCRFQQHGNERKCEPRIPEWAAC